MWRDHWNIRLLTRISLHRQLPIVSLSLGFKWNILINTINTFITYTSFTRYEINYTQNWIECSGTTVQKTWFVSCCLGGHQSCFNWNWAISKPKIEMIKTRLDGDLLRLLLCVYLLVRKFLKWNRKRLSFDNDFNFFFQSPISFQSWSEGFMCGIRISKSSYKPLDIYSEESGENVNCGFLRSQSICWPPMRSLFNFNENNRNQHHIFNWVTCQSRSRWFAHSNPSYLFTLLFLLSINEIEDNGSFSSLTKIWTLAFGLCYVAAIVSLTTY